MAESILTSNNAQLLLLDLIAQQVDTSLNLTQRLNRLSQGADFCSWEKVVATIQDMAHAELVTASTEHHLCLYVLTSGGDAAVRAASQQLQSLHSHLAQLASKRDAAIEQSLAARIADQLQAFGDDAELSRCRAQLTAELLPLALTHAATGDSPTDIAQQTLTVAGDVRKIAAQLLGRAPVQVTAGEQAQSTTTVPALTDASGELAAAHTQNEFDHGLVGISTIVIEAQSTDVRVFPTSSNELRVREHFARYLDEYAGRIAQEGQTLHVLPGARPASAAAAWGTALVTVGVPARFKGSVQIHTASGNIGVLNLRNLDSLGITNKLGNTELVYLATRQLAVTSTRGDVTLRSSNIQAADLDLESGSPLVEQSVFNQLRVHCGEGEVLLRKLNVENAVELQGGHITARLQDLRASAIRVHGTAGYLSASKVSAPVVKMMLEQGDIMFKQSDHVGGQFKLTASGVITTPDHFAGDVGAAEHQQTGYLAGNSAAQVELTAGDGSVQLATE